jgi:Cdc6-like AAA superfamily ATPase
MVFGPEGSGKNIALRHQFDSPVKERCKQRDKPEPVSVHLHAFSIKHPAGLYGEVLEALGHEDISRIAADAKKQLEAVVSNTNHSSSNSHLPMIVLKLFKLNWLRPEHADQLEQLLKMTAGSRLILITVGRTELSQTVPELQQHGVVPVQAEFKCFTDSDIVAILSADSGSVVQPLALELCAKQASGDSYRALELCILAAKLAYIDSNNSCKEVTLKHVKQAVSFLELK